MAGPGAARAAVAFPIDALPDWAAEYAAALAEATQTPPDMAGCCVLGVLSACAGSRAVVQARPGWREPVNLYLLPVHRPGSRKSAVIAASTEPVYWVQRELQQQARASAAKAVTLKEIAQKAADKADGGVTSRSRLTIMGRAPGCDERTARGRVMGPRAGRSSPRGRPRMPP